VKILGIDTQINKSWWALVVICLLFNYNSGVFTTYVVLAQLLIVMMSVLMHEFSHALTARYFGFETKSIVLYMFGGVASIQTAKMKHYEEFIITLAGPLSNFVVVAVCFMILPIDLLIISVYDYIWIINLLMGVFNLIPAYPMDGGRMLKAVLSMVLPSKIAVNITHMTALIIAGLMIAASIKYILPTMIIIAALIVVVILAERLNLS
jgi:Zn-dependent protease